MKPKIFLSYTHKDEYFVRLIRDAFLHANMSTAMDLFSFSEGDSISVSISNAIAASDFMIILISPEALKSQWMMREMETLTSLEWQQRAITVIPVKVRPCVVPKYLSQLHALDLTRSLPKGIERLVNMVRLAPSIDLLNLRGHDFEYLVHELLRAYGFRKIRRTDSWQDRGFDFVAEYHGKDPFGRLTIEQWVIEAKATRNRTDISALKEFIGSFSYRNEHQTALFVTTTQLTSAAKEWITALQKKNFQRLLILEGTDITRLLLGKPKVAKKFFLEEAI